MNCKNNLRFYLLLFIIFGSPLSYSGPTGNVNFKVLKSHHHGSLKLGKKNLVIDNEATFISELDNYPSVHHDYYVDFSNHSVVIITMGTQATGGYRLDVESVIDDGVNVTIRYKSIIPGSCNVVTCALTSPYILIEVETKKNIMFEERTIRRDYSPEENTWKDVVLPQET